MNILRRTLVGGCATALPIVLFCVGLGWSTYMVLHTSGPLKEALSSSGIYGVFINSALSNAKGSLGNEVPADNPAIKKVIETSFPPAYLESQTNAVIDSTYTWIQGKSPSLAFQLDFTGPAGQLVDGLANYADQHLASLPQCTSAEDAAAQLNKGAIDATCVPPNFNRGAAVQDLRNQLTGQDGPFHTTKLSATEIKTENGQPLSEKLHAAPELYAKVRTFLLVSTLLAVAMGAIIIFAAATKRGGLKTLSLSVLFAGVVNALSAVVATIVSGKLANSAITSNAVGKDAIGAHAAQVVHLLISDVRTWWLGFGITLIALSTGSLITLLILRKRTEHHEEVHGEVAYQKRLEDEEAVAAKDKKNDTAK